MPKMKYENWSSLNGHADTLTEARWLIEQGFWVVPCEGKKPVTRDWPTKRTTIDELEQFLCEGQLNIGIALNQSDLIDVECDGPEAESNLQKMFGGDIPSTPTWRSKRGSHRLFRRPDDLPEKAMVKIDGIEFRIGNSKGALSIVPPSVHPDGPHYEWLPGLSIREVQPAELPEDIAERIRRSASQPCSEPDADDDIADGNRNNELFKLSCKMFRARIPLSAVECALQAVNAERCKPPLPAAEVAGIAESARSQTSQKPQTYGQILLDIALGGCDLWHTPEGEPYARIRQSGHREHRRIRSAEFKQWLSRQFWEQEKIVPGSQTMQDAIGVLEGKAKFDGEAHSVHVRIAMHDELIYIDLCDDQWRAVQVDRTGWRIVDDPPVRFRRAKGMLPLPLPERGGSVDELRSFVNVSNEQWPLLIC